MNNVYTLSFWDFMYTLELSYTTAKITMTRNEWSELSWKICHTQTIGVDGRLDNFWTFNKTGRHVFRKLLSFK